MIVKVKEYFLKISKEWQKNLLNFHIYIYIYITQLQLQLVKIRVLVSKSSKNMEQFMITENINVSYLHGIPPFSIATQTSLYVCSNVLLCFLVIIQRPSAFSFSFFIYYPLFKVPPLYHYIPKKKHSEICGLYILFSSLLFDEVLSVSVSLPCRTHPQTQFQELKQRHFDRP